MDDAAPRTIELIGLRFDGYGRPGNQSAAADALRGAGLRDALGPRTIDRGDIAPRRQSSQRGPNGLINEAAVLFVADRTAGAVMNAVSSGRFPFVVGGDCSSLLGSITGARAAVGDVGLAHVDAHEDTTPIAASDDGEAANSEIGMLLGLDGCDVSWASSRGLPALNSAHLALLGQRDEAWRAGLGVASLAASGVFTRDMHAVAGDPQGSARDAVDHLRRGVRAWWLHLDVDVLDPDDFAAQGLPDYPDEPGGLRREQLAALLEALVREPGCVGASIAIYDPEQDPDASCAAFVVQLAGIIAAAAERPWQAEASVAVVPSLAADGPD